MPGDDRPIGVFDSGMGGLTVLRALLARLPNERFVYLGDTARLPYGTKSPETVQAYALQATRLLVSEGVKMVVVACNTASAVALRSLDAIHLASAERCQSWPLCSNDVRMRAAAARLGLPLTTVPG